ncbi:CopM family metallochaperone [Rhizobium halophytocola]|uniref:Uncharacterized protein (DUF305 family) n=1 Tax=Rhizobium halophytocola TaxID=735519 RepID=A0ABS4DXQ6_9HYPH|nr:DUF305 domain-containing protein [Rhizobium halophytocola]MBP1850478.1 uncharacterized protein (DUF305 family) [Rhizobium halophytocola]
MTKTAILAAALALAGFSTVTLANAQDASPHQDHGTMTMPMPNDQPSSKAFEAANMKMHKDMAVPLSGRTDVDFVASMIPHHQGAIDMAKIELAYGKDPEIRKLAEEIVTAQQAEIAMMKAWLARQAQ